MYKLFLVEDEANIRKGLRTLIEEVIGGFQTIGEAENGKEALLALQRLKPDLLITDIRMQEMNGIEMIKRIRDHDPNMEILIISGHGDFEYAKQAIKYGVSGFLLKPVDRVELAQFLSDFSRVRKLQSEQGAVYAEESDNGQGRQLIRKVKELVAHRLGQEISLFSIAELVHLNPQYLSALFKAETGQNFSEYVTVSRMNKAKQLLKDTNLKVYEIAELSGYASSKHFMAVFKQVIGVTPSHYRDYSVENPQYVVPFL